MKRINVVLALLFLVLLQGCASKAATPSSGSEGPAAGLQGAAKSLTAPSLGSMTPGVAPEDLSSSKVSQAKDLVDGYYGDRRDLDSAAALIRDVLARKPVSADAYVLAARITVKGGYVGDSQTVDLYQRFVDRALNLDPQNLSALSLQAEIFLIRQDLPHALQTLQKGIALSPTYPWFHIHLADYYERRNEIIKAIDEYALVEARGRCIDSDQRRAYPRAMCGIARLLSLPQNRAVVISYAKRADEARDPKDAYTLSDLAQILAQMGSFDEAIWYSRKALNVRDHGAARSALAFALYGRATQLSLDQVDASDLLAEANSLNFPRDSVVYWFQTSQSNVVALLPKLVQLLPTPTVRPNIKRAATVSDS